MNRPLITRNNVPADELLGATEALRWLVNLHNGVGKSGAAPTDDEWKEAITTATALLETGQPLIPGVTNKQLLRAWSLAMNYATSVGPDEAHMAFLEAQSIRRSVDELKGDA